MSRASTVSFSNMASKVLTAVILRAQLSGGEHCRCLVTLFGLIIAQQSPRFFFFFCLFLNELPYVVMAATYTQQTFLVIIL